MEKKDLVIIGSGPAGLSAAVYAQRAMLKQVVIEKESYSGGQIVVTDKVDNYLGLPGEGGYELSVRFREHADKLKVPFLEGEVVKITDQKDFKEVHMENGDIIRAKAVIIAAGASHKKLEVSGVFVAIGMKPQSEFVKDIVDIDDSGYIKAGEDCRTNVEKIYVAGDIRTKALRQVVTAVSDGAVAVSSFEYDNMHI